MGKPRISVHKFSSCDGCQLAFFNLGEDLITLAGQVEIVHFAEAGMVAPEAEVKVAFVEGSISTPDDLERIEGIRERSELLITIGACATSGGIQALRNMRGNGWRESLYASPEFIQTLDYSTPISAHVRVDLELWGCPISSEQILHVVSDLLRGVVPSASDETLCQSCKRSGAVCTLVSAGRPCMGPVTRAGCGAVCPRFGRDCYGCTGPVSILNTSSMVHCFEGLGLLPDEVEQRFRMIHSATPQFRKLEESNG